MTENSARNILVSPSLLAANFLRLQEELDMVNNSSADWLHFDVMDGRFVPNISFGLPLLQSIKPAVAKPIDVHLMIVEPEKLVPEFAAAGANIISVHIEACPHLHRNLQQIKQLGCKAGVAINPHTSISLLADILPDADLVCLMSVNPGFGGQQFIPSTYQRVRQLKKLIEETGSKALIEIDGGVSAANATALVEAGADVLVAGNAVFRAEHPQGVINAIKKAGS